MPLSEELIEAAVDRYWREYDRYAKLSEFVGDACRRLLDDNVIRGSVQWRPKNPDRLRAKLKKQMAGNEHANEYGDADSVFRVLKDLAGVRITTYLESDRDRAVQLLVKRFSGMPPDEAVMPVNKDSPDNFYRATHCMVKLREEDLVGRYQNLEGLGCEVQVCSLLAHVYNEIEHDLGYKPLTGKLSKQEQDLLKALGNLMRTGDIIIDQTLRAVEERQTQNQAGFEDEYDFVARLKPLFPRAENFAEHAGQLHEACKGLGLDSPDKIRAALRWQEEQTALEGADLAQRLADFVREKGVGQLQIDPKSSDQLLLLLLQDVDRVEQLRKLYPSGRGIGRAPRFLSIAKRLGEMLEAPA